MSGITLDKIDPENDISAVDAGDGCSRFDETNRALHDRRWRAETTDIIGRSTVPKETPEGFRIQIAAGGLTIGRGRIYATACWRRITARRRWNSIPCSPRGAALCRCRTTSSLIFPT
jgi:hypothetical protein